MRPWLRVGLGLGVLGLVVYGLLAHLADVGEAWAVGAAAWLERGGTREEEGGKRGEPTRP